MEQPGGQQGQRTLNEVINRHRVIVCVGSGGVGKTTTSAAIALRAAREGKRVLCLTIDPAKRLANSLGLQRLDHEPQPIPAEVFERAGLPCSGSLSAMMLDMKHTFDALVLRHASDPERAQRILDNRVYQYVSSSLAGTQEYMAMEKLYQVRRATDYDLIVLDTPPTSNALDFLEAPQKLVGAIDSPVMRWFVETVEGSAGLFGRGAGYVLKGLARFTGAEFLDMVNEFVRELNALFGGFRERAKAVYEDLQGDDVAFLIVTSPAPPTVAEAVYFLKKLRDYRIEARGVVVNRVHPQFPVAAEDDVLLSALSKHYSGDARALLSRMQRAALDENELADSDQQGIARLRKHLSDSTAYTEVPALEGDVHDLITLARVGNYLEHAST